MKLSECPRCKTRLRGELAHCPFDGEVLLRVADPLVGRTIAGRYLVEERLGQGGMGAVYRGRHQVIEREVAIKFLNPQFARDTRQRTRFLGEARAANQINHEHVIDVTDFGETDDGLAYLVMEYLQGRPLSAVIETSNLSLSRILRIAIQVAMGLSRAHELDVIHRDVKPANIYLIRGRKDRDFVKLLDFGIAHFERETRITDRGALVGTPEYMAPEQLRQGEVSPRSDLYSLGCVIYEMLTGSPPFTGSMAAVLVKQMSDNPVPPTHIDSSLPSEADALVLKLLQKNPKDRYRDAFHLLDDLQELQAALPDGGMRESRRVSGMAIPAARPTMHIPNEGRDWEERVALYRRLLDSAFPQSPPPPDLQAALRNMEHALSKIGAHRRELHALALDAATEQDELQAIRANVGHALDELAKDESVAARNEDALSAEADELTLRLERTSQQIALLGRSLHPLPAREIPLSYGLREDLESLVSTCKRMSDDRARLGQVRAQIEARKRELEDLHFQIGQLKGRLATLTAALSIDRSDAEAREQLLDREVRSLMDALLPEAELISHRLREHPAYEAVFGVPA